MSVEVRLCHRFRGFALDVAFAAPAGVTVLFGRSGSGKTTVVNAVAGLLRPDDGRIEVGETVLLDRARRIDVPTHRRRIGYVFQDARLFPHLTVRQNLLFGRWFQRGGGTAAAFDQVVGLLGIGHLLQRRPGRLSGGERQRVAIGRALLARPRLLLMDEPLASLDEARKQEILPFLERLRDEVRVPILYVSHSLPEVARLATTVVAMAAGRVERQGPAAEVLGDPTAYPLLGRDEEAAILEGRLVGHDPIDQLSEVEVAGGRLLVPRVEAPLGTRLRLRIRARDVVLATERPSGLSALNTLEATITRVAPAEPPLVEVALAAGTDRLLARVTTRSVRSLGLTEGRTVYALLKSVAIGRRDVGTFTDAPGEPI